MKYTRQTNFTLKIEILEIYTFEHTISVMLVRRIPNLVVGMHLENKAYLKHSLGASTFIQDENSKMKYWEHVVEKEAGNDYFKKIPYLSNNWYLKFEMN